MQKAQSKYLFQRKGTFYLRIAVPKSRRSKFGRREIQRSLNTKELSEAIILMGPKVDELIRLFNSDDVEEITNKTVRQRATESGIQYRHDEVMVSADVEDSVAMLGPGLQMLGQMATTPPKIDFATAGGVIEPPALTMRQALDQFQDDSRDMWMTLSHRERQKKWNKYNEAVSTFESVMGKDIDVLTLTRKEVYRYRSRLLERVKSKNVNADDADDQKGIKVDTVRKKLMWLRQIVRHAYDMEGRKDDSPFEDLRPIKGIGDEKKRLPILETEVLAIRKRMADVGANDELQAIIALMENTGSHAKECVLLCEDDIHLDAPIPHVCFQPNEHRSMLKTNSRIRKVPLVGIALEAMKRYPKGFPRYRKDNGSEDLSAAANEHIQAVAPKKGTYGYRHRMADLMKAVNIGDDLRSGICGWGSEGRMSAHYGTEYPLEVKLDVLQKCLPEHAY